MFTGLSKPAFPVGVVLQGLDEGILPKVGPVERRNEDFRISSLHEKKIAEAEFARSTYDQVGVRADPWSAENLKRFPSQDPRQGILSGGQWIERL